MENYFCDGENFSLKGSKKRVISPQHQSTMSEAGESNNLGMGVAASPGFASPRDHPVSGSSSEVEPLWVIAEQVRKWRMRYDGQTDPLEFLETLQERAFTYDIDLDLMPRVMNEIFVDRAARWFLSSGLRDVSWANFRDGFLEFFFSPNYLERLKDEIRSCRQRNGECFKDYLIEIKVLMHHAGYSAAQELYRVNALSGERASQSTS